MDTEDGRIFIKNLVYYIRTHERALANALQIQKQNSRHGQFQHVGNAPSSSRPGTNSSTSSLVSSQPGSSQAPGTFASALSSFGFGTQNVKPAKLYLTPNQLYYLLSRFDELGVTTGPMNVRLESIHADSTSMNYVSFLTQTKRPKGRSSDQDSLHSVSSVRSVMSSMSSMLSSFSISNNSAAKVEKRRAAELEDIRYLYSAFTKIPCLKLIVDHRIPRVTGYEEFPFDTAVPMYVFKNVTVLEVVDQDFRSYFGWDRLAEQLRSLTVKRGELDDPTDLLTNIVLDDIDRRRRRSTKNQSSPTTAYVAPSPALRQPDSARSYTAFESPSIEGRTGSTDGELPTPSMSYSRSGYFPRLQSGSPPRPSSARPGSTPMPTKKQRRASSSSTSSNPGYTPRNSSSNLLSSVSGLSASKWRFLRHLSLADNGLTSITSQSLLPLVSTLHSLDLSSNLFSEIPDSLASLVSLRALNLSNCLIGSLHTLARSPLPAISVLNLRGNRLDSLAGIEKLLSLERLDLRENKLRDPTELARLTGMPEFRDLYISRNPFVKTHPNYRVTIFNLFRRTPGYTDDITIDSTGPSYAERRQLVDRVPESAMVPVVKPPLDDDGIDDGDTATMPAEPRTSISAANGGTQELSETPQTPGNEDGTKSQRRRKAPRRRVVDMAQDSSPRTPGTGSPEASFVTALQSPRTARAQQSPPSPEEPLSTPSRPGRKSEPDETSSLKSSALPINPGRPDSDNNRGEEAARLAALTMSNEQYRKKIEALKKEYGNGWLSALGDDTWAGNPVGISTDFKEREATPSKAAVART